MIREDSRKKDDSDSGIKAYSKSATGSKNLLIEIASSEDYISQYYKIRNDIFRNEWGLNHEKWFNESHEDGSKVVVCTCEGRVVGGFRFLVSKNGELLSEEYDGTEYVYANLAQKASVAIGGDGYAEFVDLALVKEFRSTEAVKKMISLCSDEARSMGCSFVFTVASMTHCNLYRKYMKALGCKDVIIFNDTTWVKKPEYGNSDDHPMMAIL